MASEQLLQSLNMTQEEFEQSINELAKEIGKEEETKIVSMYEKREALLPLLVKHLRELEPYIDGEDLAYSPEKYSFSSTDFHHFFSLVTEYLEEDHGYAVDEECDFENKTYFLRYDGLLLEFFIMWGQGTCTIMKLVEEDSEIPADFIGSFEGWKRYMEEKHKELISKK